MKNQSKTYLQSKIKSKGTAYLLWFFLGFHHAYIGNWGRQLLFIAMPIIGFFLFLGGAGADSGEAAMLGLGLFVITGIWYFLDLFLIPAYVNTKNRELSEKIDNIERMERAELADMINLQKNTPF